MSVSRTSADATLLELCHAGDELRQAFADERAAIATLDHERLAQLATHKCAVAEHLAELGKRVTADDSGTVRDLFAAIRIEAHATALLAKAATDAVRAMLGYETNVGYDRRANNVTRGPSRYLAAY